jgi:hypothetical protein
MTQEDKNHLYNLLPAIYRIRDAEQGEPLRALLEIIDEQVQAVQDDIDDLYDDWFIETCSEWVIPYIGDVVGNRPLHQVKQLQRTDVAKTIGYRRRKGTAAMLEELVGDVTGWGTHVVEFFKLLGWTQNLNHLRFEMSANPEPTSPSSSDWVGTVNLRSMDVIDRLNGPFDVLSHAIDIRPIDCVKGWYNIRKIGFFLWRLKYYPMTEVLPRPVAGHPLCYTFSRLGNMAPLFNKPHREEDEIGLALEKHVPGPIRPMAFDTDLQNFREQSSGKPVDSDYYGPNRGLNILKDGKSIPPEDIVSMDLSDFECPAAGKVAVDVEHGLLGFATGEGPDDPKDITQFNANYTYGFSADMGGGPYQRRRVLIKPEFTPQVIRVAKGTGINTIQKALDNWDTAGKKPCIIQILDNGVYGGNLDIELPSEGWLMLQAADGMWPDLRLVGNSTLSVATGTATLIVDGLLIEGAFELSGSLDLTLQHCTVVPGRMLSLNGDPVFPDRDSLTVAVGSEEMSVTIRKSIVGTIRMPAESSCLAIEDSVVQALSTPDAEIQYAIAADDRGDEPGPPMTIERTTVFGPVYAKQLIRASEVIFTSKVTTRRQQEGCVRFSYVPAGSLTPQRYHCQPDKALAREAQQLERDLTAIEEGLVRSRLRPYFTSRRYGEPGYAQLRRSTAEEIRTGAENGSEMGAFSHLKQPQREANLRTRLEEYLPFGLEAGLIFVT